MTPLCSGAWKGENRGRLVVSFFVTFVGGICWGEKVRVELREVHAGLPMDVN
jgi:predicted RNA-binding protein with TRAM domain